MAGKSKSRAKDSRPNEKLAIGPEAVASAKLGQLVWGAFVALFSTMSLVPTDAGPEIGAFVPQAMLWTTFFAIAGLWLGISAWRMNHWDWLDFWTMASIGSSWLSLAWNFGEIDARGGINAAWQWTVLGLLLIVSRRWFSRFDRRLVFITAFVSIAAALTADGLYQYFVIQPALAARYKSNPERFLHEQGIDLPTGSPVRKLFEDRLQSVEPTATFALTNSLGGVLATAILAQGALMWLGLSSYRPVKGDRTKRPWVAISVQVALLLSLFACLLLTKSRMAMIALAAGGVVFATLQSGFARRIGWRIPVAIVVAGALILALVIRVGGLDKEVLTESPKSIQYRMEYWTATMAMICDFPIFGCGPGAFQSTYARYMLPQSSETIADPHQMLLEVTSTTGLIGLVCLAGMMVSALMAICTAREETPSPSPFRDESSAEPFRKRVLAWSTLIALLAGFLLSFPLSVVSGTPTHVLEWSSDALGPNWAQDVTKPVIWVLGIPIGIAVYLANQKIIWNLSEHFAIRSIFLACITCLLVHFSASGGISFPSIACWLAAMVALATPTPSPLATPSDSSNRADRPSISQLVQLGLIPTGIAAACFFTLYRPVLEAKMSLSESQAKLRLGQFASSESRLQEAKLADPFSADPFIARADLAFERWTATDREESIRDAEDSLENAFTRNPRSFAQCLAAGDRWMNVHARQPARKFLENSRDWYERATKLRPNSAFLHAQLATTLEALGDHSAADQEAERAFELDRLMPHTEQKLENREVRTGKLGDAAMRNAEQVVIEIRNRPIN